MNNEIEDKKNQVLTKNNDVIKTINIKDIKEKASTQISNYLDDKKIKISRNTTGRYILSIISKALIETSNNQFSYKYYPFPGTLEDNEGLTNFSLSLREDYLEFIDNLSFELHDITTNKKVYCPLNSNKKPQFLINSENAIAEKIYLEDFDEEMQKKIIENLNIR